MTTDLEQAVLKPRSHPPRAAPSRHGYGWALGLSLLGLAGLAAPKLAVSAEPDATLTGAQATIELYYPNKSTPYAGGAHPSVVVGPGAKIESGSIVAGRPWEFDFGAKTIRFRPHEATPYDGPPATFNGWVISFTGLKRDIAKVTLDKTSTFAPHDVTWTKDRIFLNYMGRVAGVRKSALFDVTFAPPTP